MAKTGGSRSFLYVASISSAPTGAVNIMEITAAVSIILPQGRPSESAIAPIEACTVALGRYESTIKSFIQRLQLSEKIYTDIKIIIYL